MKNIEGKVVVVTGGGGGIGTETCLRFAAEGGTVAVVDLNKESAQAVVERITAAGGRARAYAVDLTESRRD